MRRRKAQQSNPNTIARWVHEGRGQGEGEEYRPWLTVRDFSSRGLCHRIRSWKCGKRVLQLFSKLEYEVALLLDWLDDVTVYYEQYPLHTREETTEIAHSLGIRPALEPPAVGEPIVMTSDFLVLKAGKREVFSVKPAASISRRALEKFLVERSYWEKRDTMCRLLTDEQLPRTLIASIRQIHGYYFLQKFDFLTPDVVQSAEAVVRRALERGSTMAAAAEQVDAVLGVKRGSGLVVLKHLLARKVLPLDPLRALNFNGPLPLLCNV